MRKMMERIMRLLSALCLFLFLSIYTKAISDVEPENSPPRLLDSLWKTLKQTMDMSNQKLISSSNSMTSNPLQSPINKRVALSSPRIGLKRKTLQQHFSKRLNSNSSISLELDKSTQTTREEANARQLHRNPWRWKSHSKNGMSGCYFFAEGQGDHWAFQWCPLGVVLQGYRTTDDIVAAKHSLGVYVPYMPIGKVEPHDHAQNFARETHDRYPQAKMIEVYDSGENCRVGGIRRIATVVHHAENTIFCAGDWTESLKDFAIESVEEPFECKYIFNVCSPRITIHPVDHTMHHSQNNLTSHEHERKVKNNSNSSLDDIEQNMKRYFVESTASMKRKANPDRSTSLHEALPPMPQSRIDANAVLIKKMFSHAYDSYMTHAFPASDIKPITCQPDSFSLVRIPGLTLIDSLDTLVLMQNYTEFARAVERLRGLHTDMQEESRNGGLFALDQNVSVFETNIRVLGGLLSAHQLAEAYLVEKVFHKNVFTESNKVLIGNVPFIEIDSELPFSKSCRSDHHEDDQTSIECSDEKLQFWKYDGILLELAKDLGNRLLPAFSTRTGIPFGTINLLHGVPPGETTIASLAGAGTLTLEMELLSRLSFDPKYGKSAKLATRALWCRRSDINLVGKHICSSTGDWTETLSGIGSNSDSFYEYLAKHHVLFPEDTDFWSQLVSTYSGIFYQMRSGDWYGDVDFIRGGSQSTRRVFEALMAFYPGMQVLLGELGPASGSLNSFFLVREHLGFLPERFNYLLWKVDGSGGHHFLRPELLESTYFMHRATKGLFNQGRSGKSVSPADSSGWQWAADFALHRIEESTRTTCGYAAVRDVSREKSPETKTSKSSGSSDNLLNEMPSFFLSETLKYLYLIFDEHNFLHKDSDREWIFTTEAHPIHHISLSQEPNQYEALELLKSRLKRRLESRLEGNSHTIGYTGAIFSENEKWSVGTSSETFIEQITPISQATMKRSFGQMDVSATYSYGPNFWAKSKLLNHDFSLASSKLDFFQEVKAKKNAAHLTFSKVGYTDKLTHSCPNVYLPDFRWIHALNGGMLDYSEAYESTATDQGGSKIANTLLVGSIESIAFFGSGLHVMEIQDRSKKRPLTQQSTLDSQAVKANDSSRSSYVADMSDFEVSAFPEGNGFFVRQKSSGESIVMSLVQDETNDNKIDTYVMVQSTISEVHESNSELPSSSVVMSDTLGNSFLCEIEVVLERVVVSDEASDICLEDEDDDVETIVATYPCAPAMFGPVHIKHLAQAQDLIIESRSVRNPETIDKYGCNAEHNESSESNPVGAPSINIVHRGQCSFEEKATNQKNYRDAEGVIVINSQENELFVMSGGSFEDFDEDLRLPPTVLVTGEDGRDLLEFTESANESDVLNIKISMLRDHAQAVEKDKILSVKNANFWPVVQTSTDTIQIFSQYGWGIHAMQRSKKKDGDAQLEWQLYLIQHDVTDNMAGE